MSDELFTTNDPAAEPADAESYKRAFQLFKPMAWRGRHLERLLGEETSASQSSGRSASESGAVYHQEKLEVRKARHREKVHVTLINPNGTFALYLPL